MISFRVAVAPPAIEAISKAVFNEVWRRSTKLSEQLVLSTDHSPAFETYVTTSETITTAWHVERHYSSAMKLRDYGDCITTVATLMMDKRTGRAFEQP
jgi:hypothetical protein